MVAWLIVMRKQNNIHMQSNETTGQHSHANAWVVASWSSSNTVTVG